MQNRHSSILERINRKRPLNIATFCCHESYQSNWASLPHTFYLLNGQNMKKWEEKYRILPKNHVLLDGSNDQIKLDMNFDIVVSMNKGADWSICQQIFQNLGIPIISINHTLPFFQWNERQIQEFGKMKCDYNVFISKYSVEKWGYSLEDPTIRVIEHAIDSDLFKPDHNKTKNGSIQTIVNLWKDRDWCCAYHLGQRLLEGLPHKHFGSSDDGSTKPAKDLNELVDGLQSCSIFLNTSTISPISTALLEAASCGCTLVSTNNCATPDIFEDGVHGYFSNDESYLRDRLEFCLKNPDKVKHLGENARKLVKERFSLERHLKQFDNLFYEAIA